MADGKIVYEVDLDTKGVTNGLKDIEQQAQVTGDNAGAAMMKLQTAVTAILGAEAAVAGLIAKQGLAFNAEIEGYQTSFEVMSGSAEEAASIVERITEQAAKTPFDMAQLANVTKLMMNYGIEGDKALDMMGRLGDAAQGDSQKLGSVALAYGQMTSAGRVMLQDIKQMINAGFNPLQEISDRTGESMASLYERISKGTLSVNEINESIIRATSVGGRYFNSMEKQSQTLNGRWNTLKDTVREATGNVTQGLARTLADDVLPAATRAVEWLGENFEKLIPAIVGVNAALLAIKAANVLPGMVAAAQELVSVISAVGIGLTGMIAILAALYAAVAVMTVQANQPTEEFNKWEEAINNTNTATQNLHTNLSGMGDLTSSLGQNIETTAQQVDGYIERLAELEAKSELTAEEQDEWNKTLQAVAGLIPGVTSLIDDETGAINGGVAALKDYVTAWKEKQYAEAFSEVATEAIKMEMQAIENLSEAQRNYESILNEANGLRQQEAALLDAATQATGVHYDSLTAAADAMQALANEGGEEAGMLTDLANAMIDCNTRIEEHDKLLGEAEAAYKTASAERDRAAKTVQAYSEAERSAMNGTKTYAEAYEDAMDAVAAATQETTGEMSDATDRWGSMTNQWKLAAERDIDQGLVVALQRAGFDSQTQLAWLLTQSDAQLKQWNEVFKSDSKEAVSQITKAFNESDAPQAAATKAREVENNFKPSLYGSGASAIDGAISGMASRASSLKSKAQELAGIVQSNFNVRLQVKSPSRVMMESGRFVVEGVEVGIDSEMDELARKAEKMADVVANGFAPVIDTTGIEAMGDMRAVQQTEMVSQMAAQVSSAPILCQLNIDGREFATATAQPMSYALETLRVAEARG